MSLSAELSSNSTTCSYQPCPLHSQAHWLTSASSVAKAIPFGRPSRPEKVSASSSGADRTTMDSFMTHQGDIGDHTFSDLSSQAQPIDSSLSHLHLSALEHTSTWGSASPYPSSYGGYENPSVLLPPPGFGSAYSNVAIPSSPYSTASMYDESPLQSPYFSSPEIAYTGFTGRPPRSSPDDDCNYDEEDDGLGGKPYARLIYEALIQAPGHRMMLRDIYDWFEKNTSKPRESGTNGWQNSIRHNLSMNHAFENDKTQSANARGEPKKATSVWFLTKNALRNGVQSTTRYRKTGGIRKSALNGRPDAQRARSGAKGGRAARRAARLRQLEQSPHMSCITPVTPDDLGSFNHLMHAANAQSNFPPTRSNSPPSPEQYAYTPHSPGFREDFSVQGGRRTKYESGECAFDDYSPQDPVFSHHFDGGFDDTWLQASQRS